MKKILGILAGVALVVASVGVGAQEKYPNQPVRLIVPFPPGGGTDLVSRVIATELSKSTGWAVAPDNKPGSGGSLGLGLGGKAKPDGYTLVMAQNANLVVNPLLGVGNYDPIKDFSPVLLVASADDPGADRGGEEQARIGEVCFARGRDERPSGR